ncbi:phage tail tape measure protein [uncultured Jatrophihabitans sp.]|uniref:phage tail tape measure protein n=1 Tax=uncultured Jatrophihabitans sp. TaxID=1610747 RepID=UPI0035CBC82D
MTDLNVGALFGTVELTTVSFDRSYARVVTKMQRLGATFAETADESTSLDRGLTTVSRSSDKAGASLTRAERAAAKQAATEAKATAAAERHAKAEDEVAAVMDRVAGASVAEQRATLGLAAARNRLTAASAEAGSAEAKQATETARLASAQNSVVAATERAAAAQRGAAAESRGLTGAFAGTLKMAGELGLIVGGIEIAKKAFEFLKAGKDLTDSLNGVQAASRATDSQMKAVRAEAIGLGKDLTVPGATAVDASDAILDLVKAGVSLPRAMAAARPALLLAAAANVKTADSARVLGDVMDEFQLPATKAGKVADYLAAGANAAGGGLMAMFDAFTYVGTRARAVGLGVADIAAAITDLSKAGISGDRAGTGMAMMLQKLSHESVPGQKALDDLGVSAFNAQGKFVGLPKVIDELHAAQKRLNPKQFLSDINVAFGARAANVVAAFASKGSASYRHFLDVIKSGDVQKYADLMNRGVGAGFRQLGKEATAFGIDVYQKVEPHLASFVDAVGRDIPKAVHTVATILTPAAHIVGDVFGAAWTVASGAIHIVTTALSGVASVAEHMSGTIGDLGQAAIIAFAAIKGIQLGVAAFQAVDAAIIATKTRLVGLADSFTAVAAGERAMSGAAMTAGLLGVGVAIYALGKGISHLVDGNNGFLESFQRINAAAVEAQNDIQTWTQSMQESNGVLTDSTRLSVASALQTSGLAAAAGKAGISLTQLTTAVTGTKTQQQALLVQWGKGGKMTAEQFSKLAQLTHAYDTAKSRAAALNVVVAASATAHGKAAKALQLTTTQQKQYAAMAGLAVDKNGNVAGSAVTAAKAINNIANAYQNANSADSEYLAAQQAFAQSDGGVVARGQLISAILKENAGDALSFASSINGAATSVAQLGKDVSSKLLRQVVNMKTGMIDAGRAGAAPLINDLTQVQTSALAAAQATYTHNASLVGGKRAADMALTGYTGVERSLERQLVKSGASAAGAKRLTQQYLGVPSRVRTQIEQAGAASVTNLLSALGQQLSYLTHHAWNFTIDGHLTASAQAAINAYNFAKNHHNLNSQPTSRRGTQARGTQAAYGRRTIPPNSQFTVGEGASHTWEYGETDSQGRASIYSNAQSKAMGIPAPTAYAKGTGGLTGNRAQEAAYYASQGYSTKGIAALIGNFDQESGNRSDIHQRGGPAYGLAQWQGSRLTAMRSWVRKHGMDPTSLQGQMRYVAHELATSYKSVGNKLKAGTGSVGSLANLVNRRYEVSADRSGARASNAEREYAKLRHTNLTAAGKKYMVGGIAYSSSTAAKNAEVRARLALAKATVSFSNAAKKTDATADQIKTAATNLQAAAKRAGATTGTQRLLAAGQSRLLRDQGVTAAARSRLAGMSDYRSTTMGTLSQGFDPSQYGSVADLLAGISGATSTDTAYSGELTKLRGRVKGNATLTALVNQLAASGQTTGLATLAGASKTQLAQVSRAYSGLNSAVLGGGNAAVAIKYGNTVGDQSRIVQADQRRQDELVSAMAGLAVQFGRIASNPHSRGAYAKGGDYVTDRQLESAIARLERLSRTGHKK